MNEDVEDALQSELNPLRDAGAALGPTIGIDEYVSVK